MIKLYGNGASRWVKPYWLLKELDVPFEPVKVDLKRGEHFEPSFLSLNPFAKVPALEDGELRLFESTAICNYLAEKFPEKKLIPPSGTVQRAYYDQWMSFITCELEQPLWRMTKHSFIYPEARRSAAEIELAEEDFQKVARTLEKILPAAFLLSEFTVADIAMTYTLRWALLPIMPAGLLDHTPALRTYLERQMHRAAFPHELYASLKK